MVFFRAIFIIGNYEFFDTIIILGYKILVIKVFPQPLYGLKWIVYNKLIGEPGGNIPSWVCEQGVFNVGPSFRWSEYPTQIGHLEFDGCFRCHNNERETADGEVISNDCNLCHVIAGQGSPDNFEVASINQSLEFKHPVDIEESWKESRCTDCHTVLNP